MARGQIALLAMLHEVCKRHGSQFVIATHSPIIISSPDALLYVFSAEGIRAVPYAETEHRRA
jgi:predicted ATPase